MFDVAVLGAGPAGQAAATCAAYQGARVVMLDERPPPDGTGRLVWAVGAANQRFRLDAVVEGQNVAFHARALVLCPGAQERLIPFTGWTMPGVMGLAAAAGLIEAGAAWPGRRTVVAGCGAALAAVGAGLLAAGSAVVAVIDTASPDRWQRARPHGEASRAQVLKAGVPWLHRHRVVAAEGSPGLDRITIAPLDGGTPQTLACDTLCIGHGMAPATEAASVFHAGMAYAPERGGWVPVLDSMGRSTVPLLYVAGDAGGIGTSSSAAVSGRLAALAALDDLGLLDPTAPLQGQLGALKPSHADLAALMRPDPALALAIPPVCVVCPCEGVTRAEIEAALDGGVRDVNQLKQFTRCGMGLCQGRVCGETAAELVALRVGSRTAAGRFTARIPLRPVPMSALLGRFDYADIPVPAAAPI